MSNDDLAGTARRERKRRGLTQEQVAELAGVSPRAYQMFETRKSVPQPGNLRAILAALDIEAEGDDVARATRAEWPREVEVVRDMVGAYLMTFSPGDRLAVIHDMTRRIFESRTA